MSDLYSKKLNGKMKGLTSILLILYMKFEFIIFVLLIKIEAKEIYFFKDFAITILLLTIII